MTDLALVFPGQGSQFAGMGRTWFDDHAVVRDRFEQASDIVGRSLADLCFGDRTSELTRTRNAQLALLVLSHAMHEVLAARRRLPVGVVAGHSLGEITALLAAGALGFEDAVRLVQARGEAMEGCTTDRRTGMLAVLGLPAADVEDRVARFDADGHDVQVANYNAEQQTVLSGTVEDLGAVAPLLEELGARTVRLNVAGAFHSSHMAGAVAEYVRAVDAVEFVAPRVPVFSTITGGVHGDAGEIRAALALQLTRPVRWSAAVAGMRELGVRLWLEVGPKQVLTKTITSDVPGAEAVSLGEDVEGAQAAVDRVIAEVAARPGLVGLCLGAAAATRNRNFDDDAYTAGVIEPYRRLQELDRLPADGLTDEQEEQALRLLGTIMATKGVPDAEQEDRVASILRRTGRARPVPTRATA